MRRSALLGWSHYTAPSSALGPLLPERRERTEPRERTRLLHHPCPRLARFCVGSCGGGGRAPWALRRPALAASHDPCPLLFPCPMQDAAQPFQSPPPPPWAFDRRGELCMGLGQLHGPVPQPLPALGCGLQEPAGGRGATAAAGAAAAAGADRPCRSGPPPRARAPPGGPLRGPAPAPASAPEALPCTTKTGHPQDTPQITPGLDCF